MRKNSFSAFSIIEILVWIFVFSLWIASVYAIISSTLRVGDYNEKYIIASNLAREQIELVRNIRDSNYVNTKWYLQINPVWTNYTDVLEVGKKYKVENNFSNSATFPISVNEITSWFEEWPDKITWVSMQWYRMCLDTQKRYVYCTWASWEEETVFYRFISIEPVKYSQSGTPKEIDDSILIDSKVIWYSNGYHDFELKSILTDWKRL